MKRVVKISSFGKSQASFNSRDLHQFHTFINSMLDYYTAHYVGLNLSFRRFTISYSDSIYLEYCLIYIKSVIFIPVVNLFIIFMFAVHYVLVLFIELKHFRHVLVVVKDFTNKC